MVFANNDETKRFLKKNVISNIEYSSTSKKYYVTKYRTLHILRVEGCVCFTWKKTKTVNFAKKCRFSNNCTFIRRGSTQVRPAAGHSTNNFSHPVYQGTDEPSKRLTRIPIVRTFVSLTFTHYMNLSLIG